MKNLFIVKEIIEDKKISDYAFCVWCSLRNIVQKSKKKYFISYNMIAYSLFNRIPDRYELEAVKKGFSELVEKEYIKLLLTFNKSEYIVELSKIYFTPRKKYFADLRKTEMQQIMNIDIGKQNKYKLLRYYTCMIGTFNRSNNISAKYRGKIGGMGLDYFSNLIAITKPTVISYNSILEKNELLFILKHNKYTSVNGKVKEISNTYSRWKDKNLVKDFIEDTYL